MNKALAITMLLCYKFCLHAQDIKYNNRILVVGGGGARGAWGAGFVKAISDSIGAYRVVFGTSTGSLMAPLIVLSDFENLKEAYTSVTQKDIFNVNPFNVKTGKLRSLHSLNRAVQGKTTFGESLNLKKLVQKFLPESKYNLIKNSPHGLSFTVAVVDFKTGEPYFKSSNDYTYAEMVDWIWASANQPLFMTYTKKETSYYVDGGVKENVPLKIAVEYAEKYNIDTIDVIINKPRDPILEKDFQPTSIFDGLLRLVELWENEVRNNNLKLAQLFAYTSQIQRQSLPVRGLTPPQQKNIVFNYHFFPGRLYAENKNELVLNKEKMLALWSEGEKLSEDGKARGLPSGTYTISLDILKKFIQ